MSCARRAREENTSVWPSAKRLKFAANIEEQIEVVLRMLDNAENRSPSCQVLLASMVPGCLGPPLDERDESQMEVAGIIGQVLEELHAATLKSVARIEPLVGWSGWPNQAGRTQIDVELVEAKRVASVARQVASQRRSALCQAQRVTDGELGRLQQVIRDLEAAQERQRVVGEEVSKVEALLQEHLVPLKEGLFDGEAEAHAHVEALLPQILDLQCEDSLKSSFVQAAVLKPDSREHFDRICFQEAEERFSQGLAQWRGDMQELEPVIKGFDRRITETSERHEAFLEAERDAGVEMQRAAEAQRTAEVELQRVQSAADAVNRVVPELETLRIRLAEEKKAMSAFRFLRDRVKFTWQSDVLLPSCCSS